MRVVILAGGLGTRLAEETEVKPKPMVEIGGRPILWHIMKHYAHYGCKEFFIALGYKGEVIKRYFLDYYTLNGSMTLNLSDGAVHVHKKECEDWTVNLMDTGLNTSTGGRLKLLEPYLGNETFLITYGDGVSNVNITDLLHFHKSHGKLATVTAVRPPARFGGLVLEGDLVANFTEKPQAGEGWINGGFLVLEPEIFKYLEGDSSSLEVDTLERIAVDGQLAAYRHDDFWQCMDTLRDLRLVESLWQSGKPPWKVWE
ncbi:glucose-1-phosphate cytidylyltransferase [Crinalium epipsammum PCC 9333]|uniref:Glucose-1-phosphate cytidylyltransferase n=1 Tax=Crinalium epipsammum PCC 9333 TaxID=1173022 RepID=K9W3A7_9CYAN|nr:glucose-1-phosphate cytidylyltransferase [Crinalium epipsammum]AFZ14232.1 glucose-1-phosphate cytidylyltransferase [Crinalium epipsammum PCC 9333]